MLFTRLLKTLLQFFFASYLFSEGCTNPHTIATLIQSNARQIYRWALSPLWKPTVWLLGHRGEIQMKGLTKFQRQRQAYRLEIQRQHHARLEAVKKPMLRISGQLSNDLIKAERLWTKMFSSPRGREND